MSSRAAVDHTPLAGAPDHHLARLDPCLEGRGGDAYCYGDARRRRRQATGSRSPAAWTEREEPRAPFSPKKIMSCVVTPSTARIGTAVSDMCADDASRRRGDEAGAGRVRACGSVSGAADGALAANAWRPLYRTPPRLGSIRQCSLTVPAHCRAVRGWLSARGGGGRSYATPMRHVA